MGEGRAWWRINLFTNEKGPIVSTYVFAGSVEKVSDHALIVDGVDFFYEEKIEKVRIQDFYYAPIILHVLERHVLFEPNDSKTWRRIETLLPGITCDRSINTDDVIDRGALRLLMSTDEFSTLYEYDPLRKPGVRIVSTTDF